MTNCPYDGVRLKEIGGIYICPNHGIITIDELEEEKSKSNKLPDYIG
jgi:uncharacterized Zn finger protein (UPF0148 family)